MRRAVFIGLAATLFTAGNASAQWGWRGWGGGVGTVQGSIARGMGYYALGAGQYNLDTAEAAAINTDTVMRWNEFMFLSQMEANKREYQRRAHIQRRDSASGEAILQRLRDNPNQGDIRNGDALNVILDQVTDPRIHSSALRMASDAIPADSIASIPFFHASDAVTINLHKLTAKGAWPLALQAPEFADERAAYQDAVAQALKEDTDGNISLPTVQRVKAAAQQLRAKCQPNPPADRELRVQGDNYIRGLVGMSRMLEKPDVSKVLAELKNVKTSSLGNLLSFMHFFNLRFGVADDPKEQQTYEQLYPMMAKFRDRVLKDVEPAKTETARNTKGSPTELFRGVNIDRNRDQAPPPPPPANQP